jgi:hypothetical protein
MTINLAKSSGLPWKIGIATVDLMKPGHVPMDAEFATNVEVVSEVKALPMIGVLLQQIIPWYSVEDLGKIVFSISRILFCLTCLALITSTTSQANFLKCCRAFPLNQVSPALVF